MQFLNYIGARFDAFLIDHVTQFEGRRPNIYFKMLDSPSLLKDIISLFNI